MEVFLDLLILIFCWKDRFKLTDLRKTALNLHHFSLFIVWDDPANHQSTQLHLIDIKKCFILKIKTDIEKLSKRRTPPISRQLFLHQRCLLIGENTLIAKCLNLLLLYAILNQKFHLIAKSLMFPLLVINFSMACSSWMFLECPRRVVVVL